MLSAEELTALTLETGNFGVRVMELLDKANTAAYGDPEITKVNIGVGKNSGGQLWNQRDRDGRRRPRKFFTFMIKYFYRGETIFLSRYESEIP